MYQEKSSILFKRYRLSQMLGLLLNSIYLIVDGIFIGNRLGRDAMAAAAVAVIEVLIALSLAISAGASVIISHRLAKQAQKSANEVFFTSTVILGGIGLASYLIIGYFALIILMIFLGLAQGLQPVFSYLDGAGEIQRARQLLHFTIKIVFLVGALAYGAVLLLSKHFSAVFAPGDLDLQRFTQEKSMLYFWGSLFAGFNILIISFWQALKQTKIALLASLLRSVVVLPILIAALPYFFGRESIWISFSLGEAITAAVVLLYVCGRYKKVNTYQNPLNKSHRTS